MSEFTMGIFHVEMEWRKQKQEDEFIVMVSEIIWT